MIRILFYVALTLALGLSAAWLADRPGQVILEWQGQRAETTVLVAFAALLALLAAIVLVLWLLRAAFSSPRRLGRYFDRRKRDRGYRALSQGLIAAGAGDPVTARRMSRRSRTLLASEREPLINVLEAQTYMIEGRHDDARAKFEAMAENPDTRALGLRGLYLEARRMGASEAARQYAESAASKAPHLPWANQAALEYRTKSGNWDEAVRLVDRQRSSRILEKPAADRKKAVLLTARAMDELERDPRQASVDSQEALRLAPNFVPAAVAAGQALFRLNDLKRGSRILEKAWKAQPHPEIADTYVRARIGDSVRDRLKRARRLESIRSNHVESLRIVARAALDAHDYGLARTRCEAALRASPREEFFLLMAEIEEAETGDEGRVRHWMAQALRAERNPAWTADGYVAEKWAPLSPVTGELDAFVWKVPVEQLEGPQIEGRAREADFAARAIESLPPVKAPEPPAPTPAPAPAPTPATAPTTPPARTQASASADAGESAEPEAKLQEKRSEETKTLDAGEQARAAAPRAPGATTASRPASPRQAANADEPAAERKAEPEATPVRPSETQAPASEERRGAAVVMPPQKGKQSAKAASEPEAEAPKAGAGEAPADEPAASPSVATTPTDPGGRARKTPWYAKAPRVSEPDDRRENVSVPEDGEREDADGAGASPTEGEAKPNGAAAGSSGTDRRPPDDPGVGKNAESFLHRPTDDPGVRKAEPPRSEAAGSRFRLF